MWLDAQGHRQHRSVCHTGPQGQPVAADVHPRGEHIRQGEQQDQVFALSEVGARLTPQDGRQKNSRREEEMCVIASEATMEQWQRQAERQLHERKDEESPGRDRFDSQHIAQPQRQPGELDDRRRVDFDEIVRVQRRACPHLAGDGEQPRRIPVRPDQEFATEAHQGEQHGGTDGHPHLA